MGKCAIVMLAVTLLVVYSKENSKAERAYKNKLCDWNLKCQECNYEECYYLLFQDDTVGCSEDIHAFEGKVKEIIYPGDSHGCDAFSTTTVEPPTTLPTMPTTAVPKPTSPPPHQPSNSIWNSFWNIIGIFALSLLGVAAGFLALSGIFVVTMYFCSKPRNRYRRFQPEQQNSSVYTRESNSGFENIPLTPFIPPHFEI